MWLEFIGLLILNFFPRLSAQHGLSCVRKKGWCTHHGSMYTLMDCDGDTIPDPVCSDHSPAFGYIGVSQGCRSLWPREICISQNGQVCNRRRGWCTHSRATYLYQDCDGDGIPDPVCSDTTGQFGFIQSSQNCRSNWPHAKCRAQGFSKPSCNRRRGWCTHSGTIYTLMDCDRDGIPDPVCSDRSGQFGFIASTRQCRSYWPSASCHTKKGIVCSRRPGWCSHQGSTFMYKDCDGDGIPDPVCSDRNGNFGVIKSASRCTSGWPLDHCRQSKMFIHL